MARMIRDNLHHRERVSQGHLYDPLPAYRYRLQGFKVSMPGTLYQAMGIWITDDIPRRLAYFEVKLNPPGLGYGYLTLDNEPFVPALSEHTLVWQKGQSNAPLWPVGPVLRLMIVRPAGIPGGYYFRTRWY